MNWQFKTLRKVKVTREELALRALRAKRVELAAAIDIRGNCETAVVESTNSLKQREAEVYLSIMQKSISVDEVNEVKDKVLMIHKDHQHLEDDLEVAIETCRRVGEEFKSKQELYRTAQRAREKFDNVLEDMKREKSERDELNEELAVEDFSSKGAPGSV